MSSNEYSQLGFSNKFMFGKLMENDERCRRFLEQILGFKIHHVEKLEREKTIDESRCTSSSPIENPVPGPSSC